VNMGVVCGVLLHLLGLVEVMALMLLLLWVRHVGVHLGMAVGRVSICRPRRRRTMMLLYLRAVMHWHAMPAVDGLAVVACRAWMARNRRPAACYSRLDNCSLVVVGVVLALVLGRWRR
jgi:hypothetical protein